MTSQPEVAVYIETTRLILLKFGVQAPGNVSQVVLNFLNNQTVNDVITGSGRLFCNYLTDFAHIWCPAAWQRPTCCVKFF